MLVSSWSESPGSSLHISTGYKLSLPDFYLTAGGLSVGQGSCYLLILFLFVLIADILNAFFPFIMRSRTVLGACCLWSEKVLIVLKVYFCMCVFVAKSLCFLFPSIAFICCLVTIQNNYFSKSRCRNHIANFNFSLGRLWFKHSFTLLYIWNGIAITHHLHSVHVYSLF